MQESVTVIRTRFKFTGCYLSGVTGVESYIYTFLLYEYLSDGTFKATFKSCAAEKLVDDSKVKIGDFVTLQTESVEGSEKGLLTAILPE